MRISDWSSDVCSSDLWLTVDDQWFALAVVPKQLLRALHSVEQCEGVTALRKPLVKCDFDGMQVGGDGGYGQAQATLGVGVESDLPHRVPVLVDGKARIARFLLGRLRAGQLGKMAPGLGCPDGRRGGKGGVMTVEIRWTP